MTKSDSFPDARRAVTTLLLALSLGSSASLGPSAEPPDGPIVIFLVDTLRADRVSAYGSPRMTTPAAEALAREGVVFDNAYALSSWTRASVATLLTSRLPAPAGVFGRNGALDRNVPYLPELLRERGWKTAAFVGNGNVFDARTGFRRGFDSFTAVNGPLGRPFPVAREVVSPAIEFLRQQSSPKFFLYVHVVDPHADYFTEAPYREMFGGPHSGSADDRKSLLLAYDRAIRQADDQFPRIAASLAEKGWWRDATIFYTSDHGEEFQEHGGRAHGYTLFEEQLRIPLIVKYPEGWETPGRRRDFVTLADLTPTIADLCAMPRRDHWIGASIRLPHPEQALYFTEDLDHARLYAIRQGSNKVIVQLYPEIRVTAFDLATDPGEISGRDLTDVELPADLHSIAAVLDRWRARDLTSQPGVHFSRPPADAATIEIEARLDENPRPFLTPRDVLAFGPGVRNGRLFVRRNVKEREAFELILAANDKGAPPPWRVTLSGGSDAGAGTTTRVSATVVKQPVLSGSPSEEVQRNLRSLGYLSGPRSRPR